MNDHIAFGWKVWPSYLYYFEDCKKHEPVGPSAMPPSASVLASPRCQVTFGIPECPGSLRVPSTSLKSLSVAGADLCGEE